MLIKDIEPIDEVGVNLLKENNPDSVINNIIELPLRKPCEIFRRKGIRTAMSSANKNNVLKDGEKRLEREDIYGQGQQFFLDRPNFQDAGKGYAWIMIDFETLSDENKDYLFALEDRKRRNGENIGQRAVWFVLPCEIENIDYNVKIGKYDLDFLRCAGVPENQIPRDLEVDKRLAEFDKRHIVLGYNDRYPIQSVFLRMPVDEQTTVEEVEDYFSKLAESFKTQEQEKKLEEQER